MSEEKCSAVSCQPSVKTIKSKAGKVFITLCVPNYGRNLLLCAFVVQFFFIMAATSYTKLIHNLTLQDAVRIGLKNSRELTMANLQQEQTKASLKETLSQAYPKIMGNIGSSYINLEKIGGIRTGTSPVLTTDGEGYSNNLSLSLNQILWTGGKVANAIKCSHKEIEISLLKIEEVKNETIYKIATSYWNLKKAVELKKACEKRVDYAGLIMEIASVRYKEGLIPEVEVMKQEVNLAQAKEELIKASCSEKMAGDNLRSLLRMEGEINLMDEPAFAPLNIDEEKIVLEVMTTNSEIAERKAETKSKELQVKIARADYLPNVNLIGSYNWSGENKD